MDHAHTRPRRPALTATLRSRGAGALAALAAVVLVGALIVPKAATAASPTLTAPPTATAGTTITIDGTGFAKRQSGLVSFDDGSAVAFRASGRGSFSVALDIDPATSGGPHTIVATDQASGVVLASTTLEVLATVITPPPVTGPTAAPTPAPTVPTSSPAYTFDDEFDGASLGSVWGTSAHWTDLSEAVASRSQSSVANGVLTIAATRTSSGWKSDLVDTWGRWSQKYGYFEARMKFTAGYGMWPAFWLAEDWTSGHTNELDINETLANPVGGTRGDTSQRYYATVHYDSAATGKWSSGSYAYNAPQDLAGAWHTYAMDWRPDHITFYIDGVAWKTFTDAAHIPSVPMPVIFNLAMGGWAGATTSSTPSPSYLQVDWVRVRA